MTVLKQAITTMFLGGIFLLGSSSAIGKVLSLPKIPGVEKSAVYRVFVNGKEVSVGSEHSGGRVVETASFLFSAKADIRIRVRDAFNSYTIRPLRLGLNERAQIKEPQRSVKELHFRLNRPTHLVIDFEGLPTLVLINDSMDTDLPDPKQPNVIYFGPGVHQPGRIRVKSGQTVYLAAGAKVYGTIEGTCVENVRITGRGHLYGTKDTNWEKRTYGLVFDRCKNITIENIGIRDCYWWVTEFLLCDGVKIDGINLLSFNENNGGLMVDSCSNFTAKNSLLMSMDDCICPHALNAAGNGEEISEQMLFENLVLYNVATGNAIRIGASFETKEVHNWTFRNIDVVHRSGAAIFADHSDWAIVRNLVFENFNDEVAMGRTVDMRIDKTRYSCQTGYKDERGRFEGLYFINLHSAGGGFLLAGFDSKHPFDHVRMVNCKARNKPLTRKDVQTNEYVYDFRVETTSQPVKVPTLTTNESPKLSIGTTLKERIIDDGDPGFRSFGFSSRKTCEDSYLSDDSVGNVPDQFGKYAAAIYEPKLTGRYKVFAYWGNQAEVDQKAPWIIKHVAGYSRSYQNQNQNPGWHELGEFELDVDSDVRLVFPNYFEPTQKPVIADAVKFLRVE